MIRSKIGLYLRTIRRMKLSMIAARLRRQRKVSERLVAGKHAMTVPSLAINELDCDEDYFKRFDLDGLLNDEFLLINERYHVDLDVWSVSEASHLWNFNLHYFEYGIALAARWRSDQDLKWLDCFKRLVRAWMDACPYSKGDAWHPYTISLRLVNWQVAIDLFDGELQYDDEFFSGIRESMYRQYRHLLANQELHLRANHYWENVKTLVICAASFGDRPILKQMVRRLTEQLDEQILPDGVHFEHSLMYHKLVLEGMLRVWMAAETLSFELPDSFLSKLKLMLDAMASLEKGMGKTPFFNDAADGVAKTCDQLVAACKHLLDMDADDSIAAFPDAGYYKLYDGDIAVMFDAGEPGPSYMLGHAHCDCLSFELSYKGEPVIVNSGTYAYQSELRPYFRSSAAHNTVMVDGEEQMECWGEHRVGRSYRDVEVTEFDASHITASMVTASGVSIQRVLTIGGDVLSLSDSVMDGDGAEVLSFIHMAPEARNVKMVTSGSCSSAPSSYSPEFGILKESTAYVTSAPASVAARLELGRLHE